MGGERIVTVKINSFEEFYSKREKINKVVAEE